MQLGSHVGDSDPVRLGSGVGDSDSVRLGSGVGDSDPVRLRSGVRDSDPVPRPRPRGGRGAARGFGRGMLNWGSITSRARVMTASRAAIRLGCGAGARAPPWGRWPRGGRADADLQPALQVLQWVDRWTVRAPESWAGPGGPGLLVSSRQDLSLAPRPNDSDGFPGHGPRPRALYGDKTTRDPASPFDPGSEFSCHGRVPD